MKIKKLPNVLAIQLKRFKFQEDLGRFSKLSNRVCFTEQLGVFNTADEAQDAERIYELSAIIVHIGSGPNQGHYVAVVKSGQQWILLDDDEVTPMSDSDLFQYFGESNLGTGYLFIYNSKDYSSDKLVSMMAPDGWKPPMPERLAPAIPNNPNSLLGDPTPKPILATQELEEDEESPGQLSKPPELHVKTKRGSLPVLNTNLTTTPLTPGPMTSIAREPSDLNNPKSNGGWFNKKLYRG